MSGSRVSSLGSRSGASSPRPRFPGELLRPFMKTLLSITLQGVTWSSNRSTMASYSKDISDKVKHKMIELEPRGFKYVVTTTLSENLGQAGRADMSCHWEDADTAIQEIFSNAGLYNPGLCCARHPDLVTLSLYLLSHCTPRDQTIQQAYASSLDTDNGKGREYPKKKGFNQAAWVAQRIENTLAPSDLIRTLLRPSSELDIYLYSISQAPEASG